MNWRRGLVCLEALTARGHKPAEDHLPHLLTDIAALVDSQSQADPSFVLSGSTPDSMRPKYAAFCLARNYLRTHQPGLRIPQTGDAHIIVKDTFENDVDPVWNAIGIHLDRLRLRRNKADYDNIIANLPSDARMSLLTADQAIVKIKSLS